MKTFLGVHLGILSHCRHISESVGFPVSLFSPNVFINAVLCVNKDQGHLRMALWLGASTQTVYQSEIRSLPQSVNQPCHWLAQLTFFS
jgi:hypothetical protein